MIQQNYDSYFLTLLIGNIFNGALRFDCTCSFYGLICFRMIFSATKGPEEATSPVLSEDVHVEEPELIIEPAAGDGTSAPEPPPVAKVIRVGTEPVKIPVTTSGAMTPEDALALFQSLNIIRVTRKPGSAASPKPQRSEETQLQEETLQFDDIPGSSDIHEEIVHADESWVSKASKRHSCHICHYETPYMISLRRHLLVRHGLVEDIRFSQKRKRSKKASKTYKSKKAALEAEDDSLSEEGEEGEDDQEQEAEEEQTTPAKRTSKRKIKPTYKVAAKKKELTFHDKPIMMMERKTVPFKPQQKIKRT